jgi:hypothetical protein
LLHVPNDGSGRETPSRHCCWTRLKAALAITIVTFATSKCAVCSATKSGILLEQRRRHQRKKWKAGATLGHGRHSMRTRSFALATWLEGGANEFMHDCASANRVQITTDGQKAYLEAVESAFGADIDYGQLQKIYGAPIDRERRYPPARCSGCDMRVLSGNPDPTHVSTSYVERQNLSMGMSIRRFTRLTNAFSKKVENHAAALALWFMNYNFCRVHQTLRVTPAMEAGISTPAMA